MTSSKIWFYGGIEHEKAEMRPKEIPDCSVERQPGAKPCHEKMGRTFLYVRTEKEWTS